MKKNPILNKIVAIAVALSATAVAASVTGANAQAPSVKNGQSCTKAQYGKTTKTSGVSFKCTYTAAKKKYTWTKVAAAVAVTPAIDLTKLDRTGWPTTFSIGGVPAENVTVMQTKWQGLIQMFKDELGIDVKFYAATSYAGVIEAAIAGKIDLSSFGAMSYIVAKLNGAKVEPVAITLDSVGGKYYTSRGFTRSSQTGINKLADIRGKRVCFGSTTSTSGYLIPTEAILAAGLTFSQFTPQNNASHDLSALNIMNGTCDVGFAQEATAATIGVSGTLAQFPRSDYKEIWKSDPIPNGPFAIRSTLPASFKAAVANLLLTKATKANFIAKGYNGCTDASCTIIDAASVTGFQSVVDSFYDPIRKVCEATKSTACKA